MKIEDGADVRVAGIRAADARRIGHHGLELLPQHRFGIREIDRVAVALAHLPAVGAEHFGKLRQVLLRLREDAIL